MPCLGPNPPPQRSSLARLTEVHGRAVVGAQRRDLALLVVLETFDVLQAPRRRAVFGCREHVGQASPLGLFLDQGDLRCLAVQGSGGGVRVHRHVGVLHRRPPPAFLGGKGGKKEEGTHARRMYVHAQL